MRFVFASASYLPKLASGDSDVFLQGKNVWSQQKKKWSQVAIALNSKGKVLLLFARSPYTTYDFINAVTALPLDIKRMMYLEGGPPAQLYINTKTLDQGWLGSYSSGANESDDNVLALPFPNALAFKKAKVKLAIVGQRETSIRTPQ